MADSFRDRPSDPHPQKLHLRRLCGARLRLEILARLAQAEHLRGEVVGEAADVGVVLAHGAVVVLARHGDAVLGALELVLQLLEVLARAELRVVLRDRDQTAETLGELGIGSGHLGHVAALDGAAEPGSRVGDRDEDRILLLGDALHGVDQVRNQVGPSLELRLDLALRLVHPLVQRLDRIVSAPRGQRREHGEREGDPGRALHHWSPS